MAFGEVYRVALGVVALAWLLAWTLRRQPSAAMPPGRPGRPGEQGGPADQTHGIVAEMEREPVLVGH